MEGSDILEEITLPERAGILGSKSYRNINGKILKTTRLIFCDSCGYKLLEDKPIVICSSCGRKTCSSETCTFEFQRKHYCEQCMQERILPLSLHGFMILRCILAGVDVQKVRKLANITGNVYREALNELLEAGYIEKKGVSLLKAYEILDSGIVACKAYTPAYSHDPRVAHFESELTNHL